MQAQIIFRRIACNNAASSTYRWSCRLKALQQMAQTYFLSSLCVNRCFVSAEALLKDLPHTCQQRRDETLRDRFS